MVQAFHVSRIATAVAWGDMDVGFWGQAGAGAVGLGDDKSAVWDG